MQVFTSNQGSVEDVGVGGGQGVVAVVAGRVVGPQSILNGAGSPPVVDMGRRVIAKADHVAATTVSQHVPADNSTSIPVSHPVS